MRRELVQHEHDPFPRVSRSEFLEDRTDPLFRLIFGERNDTRAIEHVAPGGRTVELEEFSLDDRLSDRPEATAVIGRLRPGYIEKSRPLSHRQ